MSHAHLRKETDCLNCRVTVVGTYCHNCGQQNTEPKESAWHIITHFFNDVTHFDGKFFTSIKYLLTKPGFLTEEYTRGRRVSYLDPIRMYLFISAVYFLLLMSVFKTPAEIIRDTREVHTDSITRQTQNRIVVSAGSEQLIVNEHDDWYNSVHEYDSTQKALPAEEKDGLITHYFYRKIIGANQKYKTDPEHMKHMLWANFYHSLPYMLFISLPLIAMLFQLFYIRRKQFYYVSHGIFTIHLYCFVFIALIIIRSLEFAGPWGNIIRTILQVWAIVYLFLAMKRFYKQGAFKTFAKFAMIFFIGTTLVGVLALIFLIKSILNVA